MTIPEKFKRWLSEPVDGHVLGLFRVVFGLFMVYNTWSYYRLGLVGNGLLAPKILFKFEGFGWVNPLPAPVMLAIMMLMGVSAALIAAGVLFRWACWAFALSLAFFLFQEKSYFNNHIYLFVLLGVLLSFTNADHFLSLRNREGRYSAVPRWQQFVLEAQVMIVYFYGGITKINTDWLINREPITSLANQFSPDSWLAPLFKSDFMIYTLTYGGFLLDFLSPLLLWYRPVRRWALPFFIGFHLSNSRIFNDIGIFPFLMLSALILYFDTEEIPWLRNLVRPSATGNKKKKEQVLPSIPVTSPAIRNTLIVYFAFQLLFPFKGHFLPNPMDWTGIGKNFSWRMKVDTRSIEDFRFTVTNPATGQVSPVKVQSFVNEMQILNMACDARSVAAFARFLKEEVARQGLMQNAVVKARIMVRYNGRPPQLFVDPDIDLATVSASPFEKLTWVLPLNE